MNSQKTSKLLSGYGRFREAAGKQIKPGINGKLGGNG